MSKVYIDKTFRVSDNSSCHYELEVIEGGQLVKFSYHEKSGAQGFKECNSIIFPAYFAPVLGKLLLEQFTED